MHEEALGRIRAEGVHLRKDADHDDGQGTEEEDGSAEVFEAETMRKRRDDGEGERAQRRYDCRDDVVARRYLGGSGTASQRHKDVEEGEHACEVRRV